MLKRGMQQHRLHQQAKQQQGKRQQSSWRTPQLTACALILSTLSSLAFAQNGLDQNSLEQSALDQQLLSPNTLWICLNDVSGKQMQLPGNAARAHLDNGAYLGPCAKNGDRRTIGDHPFTAFTQLTPDHKPWAIGYRFSAHALTHLPHTHSDAATCYDKNHNGEIDHMHGDECVGGHAAELNFSSEHESRIAPFQWALINWNQHGHMPNGVYDKPHFDFHFYTQDLQSRNLIRTGECAMLIDCNDFIKATQPIEAAFAPAGYISVDAAEARMGNHLINPNAPEFNGYPFTHTFIFGSYEGRLSFWEPMVSLEYLQTKPFACFPIASAAAVKVSGYYPQSYCVKYYRNRSEYMVTLENFVYRAAP